MALRFNQVNWTRVIFRWKFYTPPGLLLLLNFLTFSIFLFDVRAYPKWRTTPCRCLCAPNHISKSGGAFGQKLWAIFNRVLSLSLCFVPVFVHSARAHECELNIFAWVLSVCILTLDHSDEHHFFSDFGCKRVNENQRKDGNVELHVRSVVVVWLQLHLTRFV